MEFETVILTKETGVATLVLNRPERLNAINLQMMTTDLPAALEEVANDKSVKVLVLTGAGRAFCVGGDFKGDAGSISAHVARDLLGNPAKAAEAVLTWTKGTVLKLNKLINIPTIAMVNGVANAAGCSLALACDLRIGSENARFRSAWRKLGVAPEFGDSWFLPRIVGLGRALDIILTGRWVEANEALQIGLLTRLCPSEKLEEETRQLAEQLAEGSSTAYNLCKKNVYFGMDLNLESALEALAWAGGLAFHTQEFKEAAMAATEKKGPLFEGR